MTRAPLKTVETTHSRWSHQSCVQWNQYGIDRSKTGGGTSQKQGRNCPESTPINPVNLKIHHFRKNGPTMDAGEIRNFIAL